MNQQKLFPGNRGCGQRDRGAAAVDLPRIDTTHVSGTGPIPLGRCVVIRIAGVKLTTPNSVRFASKGGAFAQAARVKRLREDVRTHILGVLGIGHPPPSRVVITRLSPGELDMDNLWASCKPCFDSIADAFGLPNDRELQKRGAVQQSKCARGQGGVVLELFFGVA